MKKKLVALLSDRKILLVVALFLIGTFLRFYRLSDFVTFLGDQGRDAIVLKRILTFEHLPAIGAPTSVGQIYLGPFYYYFIAPWLLLFRFDPIGPAIGVAFFSSLFILVNYFLVKDLVNEKVALISSVLITFSTTLIELSRFSWNPNLLPLFTLLMTYFLVKSVQTQKWYYYVATGAFLSFSIQLHYLALFLIPPVVIYFARGNKQTLLGAFYSFLSFVVCSLPLLIFDLRHDFLNSRNFLALFKQSGDVTATNKLKEIYTAFLRLNQFIFNTEFSAFFLIGLLSLVIVLAFVNIKKPTRISVFLLFFLFTLFGIALYSGPKYPHYFGSVYPFYLTILAFLLSYLLRPRFGLSLLSLFVLLFIFFNSRDYRFFYEGGSKQIKKAKEIAQLIQPHIASAKYTVTALPHQYSDSTYRYFLEVWGKRPIEKDSLERADELFVVCEEDCKPIGNPQWDIAYFAPTKTAGVWKTDDVTIYKLTR
ncbi:glycosyltransferase family 39 protein [Candidatus Roizmanbacteria bacterium]|nr:glycosyltransferase family 39 protein [Candidatus Roizmanbacteria bacterium]